MKVIKIGAIWCPGCLIMRPRWEKVEKENPWLESQYFDYDIDTEEIAKLNIGDTLPVFIFLDKEGNELERKQGELSESQILELINKYKDK